MTDIVERLRVPREEYGDLMCEAADEIERLREQIEVMQGKRLRDLGTNETGPPA